MLNFKRVITIFTAMVLALSLTACGGADKNSANEASGELNFAYQYSIAYAPVIVMKEQKLIEKYYDGDLKVNWTVLNSGSAINEGIIAGKIDAGAMGLAPAIIGRQAGIPYKIFSGISSQPYDIMTNNPNINKLTDITDSDKISVVSLNSQPHILLSMAAKEYLGDAHALDTNLVSMSNTDGMTALSSGAVTCQMCISPYNLMEAEMEGIHAIEVDSDVWPNGDTFIVGVASENLAKDKPKEYEALCKAMSEAIEYVNNNSREVAKMLTAEYDADEEDIYKWLTDERSVFSHETQGVMELATFMAEEGFLEKGLDNYQSIAFDNVNGD